MKKKLLKQATALALAGVMLTGTAYGAAQYDPVDPEDPYLPPVSGMFHEQKIDADGVTGQYSVYIAADFEPCTDGVLVLTPDGTTAQTFLDTETGKAWIRLADEKGIAVVVAEPLNGGSWNLTDTADARDDEAFLKAVYNAIRSKSQSNTAAFDMDERAFYLVGYEEGATAAQEFAMEWPSLFAGMAAVGGTDVPEAVAAQTGDALSYPFAMAESLEGQQELQLPNREIPVPVWLIDAEDTGLSADYWVDAADAAAADAGAYVQQAYENDAVRIWLTNNEHADGITPEVLYEEFLAQVQRFVGTPGGRLEWTVAHTNDGETGFFVTEQMVDGKLRRWMTYVPSSYEEGEAVPLVVAVHGYSSAMTAFTGDSRWQDVAEENGFIVVFAQGYPTDGVMGNIPVPFWNNELMGMEISDPTDDVSYFRTLVEETEAAYSIDPSRIYATGHSNGSCEVWLLAMEMSDVFAAYAPIGSNMGAYKDTVEITTEPVPIWNMKAQYDTDGAAKLEPGSTDALAIDYWTSYNGTSKDAVIETDSSGIFVTRNYYDANGVPLVRFSEVRNSPHAYTPEISQIVWDDFFSRITLNEDGTRTFDGQLIERSAASFTDIAGHWGEEAILTAVSDGLFNGTSATTFSPDDPVTRGMAVTVLGRLAGADDNGTSSFTDVSSEAYYSGYVAWAEQLGIVSGSGDQLFEPEQNMTREELAVIIGGYAEKIGIAPATAADISSYTDADRVSNWAADGMAVCCGLGVISGKEDNCLDPQGLLTRAELATMMVRLEELA